MSETPGSDDAEPITFWIDEAAMGRALDPTPPPDVIALQDTAGHWWRYPLAEFPDEGAQTWVAPEDGEPRRDGA